MNSLTAVSDVTERGAHILARSGRSDGKRAFRAAVRHSRHVRILRIAVPLSVVLVVVGGVAFTALLKPLRVLSGANVDVGSLVVSGTKIMMQQPRLAGFTRDNRRYNMIAQAAAQDVTKPDMVELHGINATMEMKDGSVFETTAKDGLYNSKTEQLTLSQDIVVTSSSGYKAFLNEAVVDVRAGRIVSDKPVEVKTATWTINANGMDVAESGDLMRFDRGVFVTLMLEGAKPVITSDGRKP
jgi:lipopolysaccharide export system protein LptC